MMPRWLTFSLARVAQNFVSIWLTFSLTFTLSADVAVFLPLLVSIAAKRVLEIVDHAQSEI